MGPKAPTRYLPGYPPALVEQVHRLIDQDQLAGLLLQKYPAAHGVRTDRALYEYVLDIKNTYLRNAGPVNKVCSTASSRSSMTPWACIPVTRGCRAPSCRPSTRSALRRSSRTCPPRSCAWSSFTNSRTSRSGSTTKPSINCAVSLQPPQVSGYEIF